jgi:hypothetical protein
MTLWTCVTEMESTYSETTHQLFFFLLQLYRFAEGNFTLQTTLFAEEILAA